MVRQVICEGPAAHLCVRKYDYRCVAAYEPRMNKARFEAFSDGVFSFAVTLLVLGIVLPQLRDPSDRGLTNALLGLWPDLLAYALSFAVIGIMWQNHHALFRRVERIDRRTIFINLMLLATTVFIPFATSTLGTFPTLHASTFLYGVVLTCCSIWFNVLLMHLIDSGAFYDDVTDAELKPTVVAYRVGLATYSSAMLVALFSPLLSFAAYLALVAYYLVPRGLDSDRRR
jgi:uncharacterized membrane protein